MSNKDMKGKQPKKKGGGRRERDGAAEAVGENFPFPHSFKESCIQEKSCLSTNTKKKHIRVMQRYPIAVVR